MGCEAAGCKTSTSKGIFIMTPSLEGWSAKAKETPSPHVVRLAPLDINPVFQFLGVRNRALNRALNFSYMASHLIYYSTPSIY